MFIIISSGNRDICRYETACASATGAAGVGNRVIKDMQI
jgi:hypothetical protein